VGADQGTSRQARERSLLGVPFEHAARRDALAFVAHKPKTVSGPGRGPLQYGSANQFMALLTASKRVSPAVTWVCVPRAWGR
jgi:hypothetical protein